MFSSYKLLEVLLSISKDSLINDSDGYFKNKYKRSVLWWNLLELDREECYDINGAMTEVSFEKDDGTKYILKAHEIEDLIDNRIIKLLELVRKSGEAFDGSFVLLEEEKDDS